MVIMPLWIFCLVVGVWAKVTLKIGSIVTQEHAEIIDNILDVARENMKAEGVIDDDFDIEVKTSVGCGSSFEGVAAAAEFYHVNKVDAFFGPYCTQEIASVATMAAYWNVPIFAYTATSAELSESKIYKTLVQTSFQTQNAVSEAVSIYISHQNWTKVAIVSNIGADSFEKVASMERSLKKLGITVTSRVLFEESAGETDLVNSGILDELRNNARVIIPIFSSRKNLLQVFRNATILAGFPGADFIYIFPMTGSVGNEPPIFLGSSLDAQIKDQFPESIQIYDSNLFQDEIVTKFLAIFKKRVYIDEKFVYNYISLYESYLIFAKFAKSYAISRENIEKNGTNIDGKEFCDEIRGKSVDNGVLGKIEIGNVPLQVLRNFRAFYLDPTRENIRPVADINSSLKNGTVVTESVTKFWHSESGRFPDTDPECGFRNEKCDYTEYIIIGSAVICCLLIIGIIFWMRRICENNALTKMPWRIMREDVQILDEEQAKSVVSLNSVSTKMSQVATNLIKNHAIVGVNTHAVYDIFEQRQNIKFQREDLVLLTKMKQAVHDNLNPFIGISFNERNELLLLWKFCSRGTLQDVIYCDKFVMDEKFHGAFVKDITLGLEYLHNSTIGYHGCLSSWSTLIDKNWMVKLTDFAVSDSLKRWEKHGKINCKIDNESEKRWQRLASLYIAPDLLQSNMKNRRNRNQKWKQQNYDRRKSADIYAFGIIIYEIMFRSLPFNDKLDLSEMANKADEGEKIQRPTIQKNRKLNPDLTALLQDCWSELPEQRPTIRRVRIATDNIMKTKGSLVDSMMRMMEEYANNLEKLVGERTKMAEEANSRAERLLFQLLPKNVAIDLKAGKTVPPKAFHSATVMFSDICGFTKLCSSSTPIEVVKLLNALYSEFDQVITKNLAYKVETIGDAYMVVSGVPDENGKRHVASIALVTLEIVELLKDFEVPHRKGHRLEIRFGFATGPVAAAVIGLNAPKYCIFGETVNTAAIMESSGEGGRVQITECSKMLLEQEYPEFIIEIRGINKSVRQKDFVTYWLNGKDDNYFKNNKA